MRHCQIGIMEKLTVFGDSYVNRMGRARLNIHALGSAVTYFGVPGLGLSAVQSHPEWKAMKTFAPTQVFLHLGGNSINTTTTEGTLVDEILKLREELLRERVRRVFVGEILPRGDVSRSRDPHLTVPIYDDKRKRINRALQRRLGRWFIHFFSSSAFRPTPLVSGGPSPLYNRDLVHLSDRKGLREYRKGIKRAFLPSD